MATIISAALSLLLLMQPQPALCAAATGPDPAPLSSGSLGAVLKSTFNRRSLNDSGDCCFAQNCLFWVLNPDGHTVAGECWNKEDQRHWVKVHSALDLNLCLLNTEGQLVASSQGDFYQTCVDCVLNGTVLACDCRTLGGVKHTSIDLDNMIAESQGQLSCFDEKGTITSTEESSTE